MTKAKTFAPKTSLFLKPGSRCCHNILLLHIQVGCDEDMIFSSPFPCRSPSSWNWPIQPGVTSHLTPRLVTTHLSGYCGFLLWRGHIPHLYSWPPACSVGPLSEFRRIQLPAARSGCGVSLYCWSNPLRPLLGGRSLCASSSSVCSLLYDIGETTARLGWSLYMTINNRDHWWMPRAYVPL